ncbi:hypothetical protein AJ80_09128 [Polytolypa hystricis UAMH7299]|uniref:Protein artemis n=1 Tax=Polytolypa hystricis (strain UAMH7299) TaxID=1447883 RepID=A0A2B7WW12_POLH7|nr:hypothetical protein AJ80_09128 [Polytolypa hystricis UAMH7299]
MSTFNGIVEEFPNIRIDYFRKNPDYPPPLACFLSHVHSDHLQGLESLRAPFVYCSAATREILLRIEKYPHRMNFSKGILESRKQHYKHLAKLLRPLPLQVPTEIELMPRSRIRVTLFDANHCPGAVMFLIEGNGKSILYTGDIRAEGWWVDCLIRNPVLIPYTLGGKSLGRIYLDTTFAIKTDIYSSFPTKAEGIRELLEKMKAYPEDTLFYLRVWTFGYEEVWQALSAAFNSKIHVDRYQMGLYNSLGKALNNGFGIDEAPFLCGFTLGNSQVSGCLSQDPSARIHSCEPGTPCSTISAKRSVYITPIVTRSANGHEIPELGAGGGKGDLHQTHELELPDDSTIQQLAELCLKQIQDGETRSSTMAALTEAYKSRNKRLSLDVYGIKADDEISLEQFISILSRGQPADANGPNKKGPTNPRLPNSIRFPYSRHSSYSELCTLVQAFKPRDVYPCTVDPNTWTEDVSMRSLFSHLCSGTAFPHDNLMRGIVAEHDGRPQKRQRRGSDASSSAAVSTQKSDLVILFDEEEDDELSPIAEEVSKAQQHTPIPTPQTSSVVEDSCAPPALPYPLPTTSPTAEQTESHIQTPNDKASSHHNTPSNTPNPTIDAIKRVLKHKRQNHELDFSLLSSFSSTSESQGTTITQQSHVSRQQQLQLPPVEPSSEAEAEEEAATSPLDSDSESTISIPSSAFDSQQSTSSQQQTQTRHVPPSSSRESRRTAYRAARSRTYDAWSSFCSVVTAGNNHVEEEMEL